MEGAERPQAWKQRPRDGKGPLPVIQQGLGRTGRQTTRARSSRSGLSQFCLSVPSRTAQKSSPWERAVWPQFLLGLLPRKGQTGSPGTEITERKSLFGLQFGRFLSTKLGRSIAFRPPIEGRHVMAQVHDRAKPSPQGKNIKEEGAFTDMPPMAYPPPVRPHLLKVPLPPNNSKLGTRSLTQGPLRVILDTPIP